MKTSAFRLSPEISARMREGLVWLDARGQVQSFNSAGKTWLSACLAQTEALSVMVAEAGRGAMHLPARIALFNEANRPGVPLPETWLDHDGKQGYVLILIPQGAEDATAPDAMSDQLHFIGPEVREEFIRLGDLLARFANADVERDILIGQARVVAILLAEVSDLAELHQRDASFSEERFPLGTLVTEILPRLPHQTGAGAIDYAVSDDGGRGHIYGNRDWMRQALLTLLGRMGEGCPPGYRVQANLRQLGDFMVLSAGVRVCREAQTVKAAVSTPSISPGIHMQICRRIITLHGGHLKVVFSAPDQDHASTYMESFRLTLPTGLPVADRSRASCENCRITHQALEYARDLSNLLTPL